tara:strand:+ start:19501 stop:20040 length:540 start_codon:yes stop_codon:yes gene_type:complete
MADESTGDANSSISNDILSKFIFLVLLLMVVQAFPIVHPFQRVIRAQFVPVAWATGLKQGEWALFSPEIKRNNAKIEAVGSEGVLWETPDWAETGIFEKWRSYRMSPYETILPFMSDSLAFDGLSKFAFDGGGGTTTRPAIVWSWIASEPPPSNSESDQMPNSRGWDTTLYSERTLLYR